MRNVNLWLVLVLLVCSSAFSASMNVDLEKLPPDVAASLIKARQEMANPTLKVPTVETVDQWVGIGEKMAAALGACAAEVGMAVNDFINTSAGKWTVFLIFWQVAGSDMKALFIGVPLWLLMMCFVVYFNKVFFGSTKVYINGDKKAGIKELAPNKVWKDEFAKWWVAGFMLVFTVAISVIVLCFNIC